MKLINKNLAVIVLFAAVALLLSSAAVYAQGSRKSKSVFNAVTEEKTKAAEPIVETKAGLKAESNVEADTEALKVDAPKEDIVVVGEPIAEPAVTSLTPEKVSDTVLDKAEDIESKPKRREEMKERKREMREIKDQGGGLMPPPPPPPGRDKARGNSEKGMSKKEDRGTTESTATTETTSATSSKSTKRSWWGR